MGTLLEIDGVSYRYNGKWVLQEVSFAVEQGDFMGIIGPNGSGKTTLLNIMDGAICPQKGRVWLEGKDIRTLKRDQVARKVAVVSQENRLTFSFTALEVVLMGRFPHLGRFRFEQNRDYEVAYRAMELTDTLAFKDRNIYELSGGERQRVFIARALAQEPRAILFDEPTAFLDLSHQVRFFDLIYDLNQKDGLTIVAVSHDINLAAAFCRELLLLCAGRIYKKGPPEEVITEQAMLEVYGERVLVDRNPVVGSPRITLMGKNSRRAL